VTLQLGNPQIVAARTGITTVADFRQTDVAVGGQGAPLVPWTDWLLFKNSRENRAIQNIGGIGNVTFVPSGGGPEDVIALDTGPGNMIIDLLVQYVTRGRETYDRDGRRASRGKVLPRVLERWMRHPFLRLPPPRTTGRETFGRPFVQRELPRLQAASGNPDDWIATATAFTARTIADAYRRWLPGLQDVIRSKRVRIPLQVVLCGGGACNPALRALIGAELPGAEVSTIADFGLAPEAKEAVSFAMLAWARLCGLPSNLRQATGARHPACLGVRVEVPLAPVEIP
jgi:anhydro-N-acetylmuramic acid kinase